MTEQVYSERLVMQRLWTDCPDWALPTIAATVDAGALRAPHARCRLIELEGSPGIVAAALIAIQANGRIFVPATAPGMRGVA